MANPDAMRALESIEGFRSLNVNNELEAIINLSEKVKKAKSKGGKFSVKDKKELTEEEKEYKSKRKMIQEKLIKFSTKIPVFMYLSEYREETLKHVITQLEPNLFKRVTGLGIKDFELLVSLNVFNASLMNDAVYKFKRYEDSSLTYTGINMHEGQAVGGFDTVITREEFDNLYESQRLSINRQVELEEIKSIVQFTKKDAIHNVKSVEHLYKTANLAKKYILQIIEICKLHNKEPIFIENNLLRLWDDLEKQCTTRNEYKLFTETLYKLLKENTRYKNPNYRSKTDPFYIFMLPDEFYKKNQETKHFISIVDTLRHFHVHDEIGKSGDVFEELLGNKSGPQTGDDYQKLQNEVLLKFEKSMEILLSIVKREFEQPKKP
jgi:hypothetical protein